MAANLSSKTGVLALTALLFACTNGEAILQGERLTPRAAMNGEDAQASAEADKAAPLATGAASVPVSLPAARGGDWTHRAGNGQHNPGNAAYSGALAQVWAANIGKANSRKNRGAADPIVAGGRIFTLDSGATVAATAPNGGALWQADLMPASDHAGDGSGGGLAYGEGLLFATTGYGEIIALNPASGGVIWRQKVGSAIGGAPAVAAGKVFAVARDGSTWAVDAKTGKVAWQLPGSPSVSGVTGASSPATDGTTVYFPLSNGVIRAIKAADGTPAWIEAVGGRRLGRAFGAFSDVTGDPVIAGGTLYAATSAGATSAMDAKTGQQIWHAGEGASSPVVVTGNAIFMANDEDQLVRLDAASGAVVWRIDMPYYLKDKAKRRKAIHAYYGPVLAGGRLIVASSDGVLQSFDPASGRMIGQADLPGGAASAPVVAGGVLYVVSGSGKLLAFR